MPRPVVLGLGGTTRSGSITERALRVSLRAVERAGADTILIAGPDLTLPLYDPGACERTPAARRLTEALRRCDGLLIASPAYHGSLSGLVKNALDYTEDLRVDRRAYLDGVAVGLIACAAGSQAAGQTLQALRAIAHALRGWPTPLGAALTTSVGLFDDAGECRDDAARLQLETVGRQVVDFCRMRRDAGAVGSLAAAAG